MRLSDQIGHYVFHGKPKQLDMLRAALEQARNEIKQKPNDGEDRINGLAATAERAVRMTDAQHWPLVKVRLGDGTEAEVYQFQRDPEEQRLIDEKASRAQASLQHQNVRMKMQAALLDRAKSTTELVTEGVAWAQRQTGRPETQPMEDDDDDNYNREWDRRAVVTAAALAARDYEGPNRSEVVAWALPVLQAAATARGKEYPGNDQIEHNATAIATLGLLALYLKEQNVAYRDALLRLAAHQHLSVINALGRNFPDLSRVDARLPRSVIRIVMVASVHFYRSDSQHQTTINQQAYDDNVSGALTVERNWLDGTGGEPAWPELAPWRSRPRRGTWLPGGTETEDEDVEEESPDQYVDEQTIGAVAGYLIRFTVGELPAWVVTLAEHFMSWTYDANGPHGENDGDRDNRPLTWNSQFFDFLGILCVALPHDQAFAKFLVPITQFKDEAFHDAMAEFLRGFDRAMQAIDTKKPENPAAFRELLADHIRKGWNYKRLGREKGTTSESHAGDALNAMFYQPHRIANRGHPSIPDNWEGLDSNMPTLVGLAVSAATSGYIATLFLNLIESSPRGALLPFVVEALTAWCAAYGVDTNFWSEKEFGGRVCVWLDRTFTADPATATDFGEVEERLLRCLDVLVRSGVAQAKEVEQRIASMSPPRKIA